MALWLFGSVSVYPEFDYLLDQQELIDS